jgi:threonyl-tRNA synthetase
MFLVESEHEQMAVKARPPRHMLTRQRRRSYRDPPIRYHEQTLLHRNEASGVLA